MKWKRITASVFLFFILAACGNPGTDESESNEDTANQKNTARNDVNTEDVNDDTMTNDENATIDNNNEQDDDFMKSKMEELNFYEISIEVKYTDNQEFEASIDQDRVEPLKAEVEDELNKEYLRGGDAYEYIFEIAQKLKRTRHNTDQEEIQRVLGTFELPEYYLEIEEEIKYKDNKELEVEDRN